MAASELPRRVARGFYLLLVLGGLAIYVGWALWFGVWNPLTPEGVGLYAILVLFVGFGVVGWLLYKPRPQ
jgi:hypothetical protein